MADLGGLPVALAQVGEACGPGIATVGAVALLAASASDLATRLIPNRVVAAAAVATCVVVIGACPETAPGRLLGAALCAGPLMAVTLARPEGMGMGDVKLAGLIGLMLGPGHGVLALALACMGGVLAGVALLPTRGRAALRTGIPFAPFLAGGAMIAWVTGAAT